MSVFSSILVAGGLQALASIFGAKSAASAQTKASLAGIDAQLAMFGITRAALAPFMGPGGQAAQMLMGTPARAAVPAHAAVAAAPTVMTLGGHTRKVNFNDTATINRLKQGGWKVTQQGHAAKAATKAVPGKAAVPGELSKLIKPIVMDQKTLEATPGYKFALAQGEKAVGNALTARGLGVSGAQIKGAETFAEGLAAQTQQQQFNQAMANKEMTLNALMQPMQIGEAAAAGIGTGAAGTGAGISQNLSNIGSATAAGDIATASAIGGFGNSLTTAAILPSILARGGAGSGITAGNQ